MSECCLSCLGEGGGGEFKRNTVMSLFLSRLPSLRCPVSGPGEGPKRKGRSRGGGGPICVQPWQHEVASQLSWTIQGPWKISMEKMYSSHLCIRVQIMHLQLHRMHTVLVTVLTVPCLPLPLPPDRPQPSHTPILEPTANVSDRFTSMGHPLVDKLGREGGCSPGCQYSPCHGCMGSQSSNQNLKKKQLV